jgi:hypothetical protein
LLLCFAPNVILSAGLPRGPLVAERVQDESSNFLTLVVPVLTSAITETLVCVRAAGGHGVSGVRQTQQHPPELQPAGVALRTTGFPLFPTVIVSLARAPTTAGQDMI